MKFTCEPDLVPMKANPHDAGFDLKASCDVRISRMIGT
jgi:hypothetical protein